MSMQRRLLATVLALVLTAGLFGMAAAQDKKPAGKIATAVVENKTVQLGEVLEGQEFRHTFKIKNIGGADLEILSVKPG